MRLIGLSLSGVRPDSRKKKERECKSEWKVAKRENEPLTEILGKLKAQPP